mmetsp:Transcript_23084/g.30724  ORF Transcript_23084/g.30724 Transcript_23084/m.30724 type:complete len:208 (-) Transcript_23084:413-1036(-)
MQGELDKAREYAGDDLQTAYLDQENVKTIQGLLTSDQWDYLFPIANEIYSYTSFLQAAARFPDFCGSAGTCARELATFFAHTTQESGKSDGNYYIDVKPDPPSPEPEPQPQPKSVDNPQKYGLLSYLNATMSALVPFSGAIFAGILEADEKDDSSSGGGDDNRELLPIWRQSFYHVTESACTPEKGESKCDYKSDNWSATVWPPKDG